MWYLAEVGRIDLCLHHLRPLGCRSVVMPVVHPFLFVQTLREKRKTNELVVRKKTGNTRAKAASSTSHLVCDLSTEFGVDDIRRVCYRRVLEGVRLLAVVFL